MFLFSAHPVPRSNLFPKWSSPNPTQTQQAIDWPQILDSRTKQKIILELMLQKKKIRNS